MLLKSSPNLYGHFTEWRLAKLIKHRATCTDIQPQLIQSFYLLVSPTLACEYLKHEDTATNSAARRPARDPSAPGECSYASLRRPPRGYSLPSSPDAR